MKRTPTANGLAETRKGLAHNSLRRAAILVRCAALLAIGFPIAGGVAAHAETCTTQSGLAQAQRDSIADAARSLATTIQANNAAGLRMASVAEVTKDFGGMQYLAATTASRVAGAVLTVEQVYLLDATSLKRNADGSAPDAQFFCSLNPSTMEVQFDLPALPPGKYALAIVTATAPAGAAIPAPWRLTFLMREEQNKWLLAGFYPKPMTAASHDGLWYWKQARQMAANKQPWNAWLYYGEAAKLLQPANFVLSTHLDKLQTEAANAAPPALSEGVSIDAPLVVKGADGTEYRFIGLGVGDSSGQSMPDVEAHLHVDALADPAAARKRNNDAASALLAAYPEMRKAFNGISIYAEALGQNPFVTNEPIAEIK